jgi:dTDP-glucose 4,6-dehydratase
LYVEDHCRAIELILEKGVIGNTYLIGGLKKDVTNLELIKMIIKVMGKSENQIEYVKDRLGHDQKYAVDWTTMEALGWKPSVTLQEGLERTIEWYVKNQNWWRQIKK